MTLCRQRPRSAPWRAGAGAAAWPRPAIDDGAVEDDGVEDDGGRAKIGRVM